VQCDVHVALCFRQPHIEPRPLLAGLPRNRMSARRALCCCRRKSLVSRHGLTCASAPHGPLAPLSPVRWISRFPSRRPLGLGSSPALDADGKPLVERRDDQQREQGEDSVRRPLRRRYIATSSLSCSALPPSSALALNLEAGRSLKEQWCLGLGGHHQYTRPEKDYGTSGSRPSGASPCRKICLYPAQAQLHALLVHATCSLRYIRATA